MSTIEQTLSRLQKSAFRAKFHLSEKDRQYIMDKGIETIQRHADDFIRMRLAPAIIPNDRHRCVDIQCLSHSTPAPAAVAAA